MSFVDLATLALHRRSELEGRINTLDEKCDRAIKNIKKLKTQAHGFVSQIHCEPNELKERFLMYMKKLDEYMYLITDFNLALEQLEDYTTDHTPVQDQEQCLMPTHVYNPKQGPYNLLDALSEPTPTMTTCPNLYPSNKAKSVKVPKAEQVLIEFSSASSSTISMPDCKPEKVTQDQSMLVGEMENVKLEESAIKLEACTLPGQAILEANMIYRGTIMNVENTYFWVIADDTEEVTKFMLEITDYYRNSDERLTPEQLSDLCYCAYHDDSDGQGNSYYRGMFLKHYKDTNKVQLFLVDTGEIRTVDIECARTLAPQFCSRPPYARLCHLAGLDFPDQTQEAISKREALINNYIGVFCAIEIDDNTSETLGVYITFASGEMLNHLMLDRGLAVLIENYGPAEKKEVSQTEPPKLVCGPPEVTASDLDMTQCPEYEDPVEAVTGYHNRDEADICKHYKGGPEKTCFKGLRCHKKHIVKHPDGWTLDKVAVVGNLRSLPVPEPGSWHKVVVTNVCHFDRVWVQYVSDGPPSAEEIPQFGVILPPTSLGALFRDMNSPATVYSYKPLAFPPAPREVVAALYPADKRWYRATVLTVTRADQSVEVMYIDYGTVLWVKEDNIRQLDERFAWLPCQAVRCVLAGVFSDTTNSQQWAAAKRALSAMVLDKKLDCHVIARDYDEMTVELFDERGHSVAELMAADNLIKLREYSIIDDSKQKHKLVVP